MTRSICTHYAQFYARLKCGSLTVPVLNNIYTNIEIILFFCQEVALGGKFKDLINNYIYDANRGSLPARPQDTGIPLSQQAVMAGWGTPRVTTNGATAHLFADEGAKVAVLDRNAEGVTTVVQEITQAGGEAKGWTLDLGKPKIAWCVLNVRQLEESQVRIGSPGTA